MEDLELLAAQQNLEQKRQQLGVISTTPPSLPVISLAHLKTAPASGDVVLASGAVEWCHLHRSDVPCPECERQSKEKRSRNKSKVNAALVSLNIGARYKGMTFSDYQQQTPAAEIVAKTCERYAATFTDRLRNCDNLLMLGNPGTGKNMLAACICTALVENDFTVLHTTAMKLIRKIKESWGRGAETTEQKAINQFSLPDLLVIDEVGVQFGSETEKILLFEVVNDRYENMRPTIIISNLSAKDVEGYLGTRTIDRFHEGKSAVLEFTWGSYRRQK